MGAEGADSNVELLEGVQGSEAGKNEARLEELAGRLSTAFRNAEKGGRDDANMGQDDQETMPILCAKDRRNKFLWAFMLNEKGVNEYNTRVLKDLVLETG